MQEDRTLYGPLPPHLNRWRQYALNLQAENETLKDRIEKLEAVARRIKAFRDDGYKLPEGILKALAAVEE